MAKLNEVNVQPDAEALRKTKVLVVEDNADAQLTICEMLSILDYEAIGVASGLDALDMLESYDILLTDVHLPGMSGIELAKKAHALHPAMGIIISSGMDVSTELDFDLQTLPKPFSMTLLTEILQKAENSSAGR